MLASSVKSPLVQVEGGEGEDTGYFNVVIDLG